MPKHENNNRSIPFEAVLTALLDETQPFPPLYLHRFSDIGQKELDQLAEIWPQVNPKRRQNLLEDLEELSEADTLVSFDDLSIFALNDPEPAVRALAIRLLWEDQDQKLIPIFVKILETDSDPEVRAAAALALGLFVYLGELEELPKDTLKWIEDTLLKTLQSDDLPIVRRRALEALGFSSRDEVVNLIQSAFETDNPDWQSSALFAMSRSADPRWEKAVLQMLPNTDSRVQVEAVRAAGQLELPGAREPLLEMLEEEDLDEDIFAAAIWSLSQIGGENVRETLERLLENIDDDDETDFIDQALENLSFTEDFGLFEMFDFDEAADDENMKEVDLLEESDEDDDRLPGGDGKGKKK